MRIPNVILLSASERETAELERILGRHVTLTPVSDPIQLESLLEAGDYDAVFCGWTFPRATWHDVVQDLRELRPDLPVIVLAPAPDVRQWADVLEAGAFDLLIPPYEDRAVLATLEHASVSRTPWTSESALKLRA
jgi:DNA-binding NtrC family response regulator